MKFSTTDMEYIEGKSFSNGYKFEMKNNLLYSRIDTIKNICKGASVIHVGCCDHLPLIDRKIRSNNWLQRILDENCRYVIGIDINVEAIQYINKNKLAKNPVLCVDITTKDLGKMLPQKAFDYVVMGEIVEHLDNPESWLSKVKKNLDSLGFHGKFIITVPNAFSFLNSKYAHSGIENINSDHKYWFTPYTISKGMYDAGIVPEEILFASYGKGGNGSNVITGKVFRYLETIRKRPSKYKSYRGDQLVVIGR